MSQQTQKQAEKKAFLRAVCVCLKKQYPNASPKDVKTKVNRLANSQMLGYLMQQSHSLEKLEHKLRSDKLSHIMSNDVKPLPKLKNTLHYGIATSMKKTGIADNPKTKKIAAALTHKSVVSSGIETGAIIGVTLLLSSTPLAPAVPVLIGSGQFMKDFKRGLDRVKKDHPDLTAKETVNQLIKGKEFNIRRALVVNVGTMLGANSILKHGFNFAGAAMIAGSLSVHNNLDRNALSKFKDTLKSGNLGQIVKKAKNDIIEFTADIVQDTTGVEAKDAIDSLSQKKIKSQNPPPHSRTPAMSMAMKMG